jgi:hypothetical protein
MNTRKTIYNKLFKEQTKLTTHEVELGLLEDTKAFTAKVNVEKSNIDKMKVKATEIKKMIEQASKLKLDMEKTYSNNKTLLGKLNGENRKLFDNISKQVKEIGVDINSVPAYKEYVSTNQLISELQDVNQANWNILSQI